MNPINMKRFENLKFGVELDSEGETLNEAQWAILKALNILCISALLVLTTIVAGNLFSTAFLKSPLLMMLGSIVSFIFLLIAQLGTLI